MIKLHHRFVLLTGCSHCPVVPLPTRFDCRKPHALQIYCPNCKLSKQYHLHIGRVQPDNHVHEILSAAEDSGETLVTIGDYSTRYGRTLKGAFDHCRNIHFLGSIYDKTILNALRQHSLFYIHGHSAGGTNPALLEALGCGCFVLAHGNPFNGSVLGGLGGLWVQSDQLSELLQQRPGKEILAQQQELAWERMKTHFQWKDIAAEYIDAFHEIGK